MAFADLQVLADLQELERAIVEVQNNPLSQTSEINDSLQSSYEKTNIITASHESIANSNNNESINHGINSSTNHLDDIKKTGSSNAEIIKKLSHDDNNVLLSQENNHVLLSQENNNNKLTKEMEINVLHHQITTISNGIRTDTAISSSITTDTIISGSTMTDTNTSSATATSVIIEPPTPISDTIPSTSFMTRVSSPLKQSYIPEIILDDSDDEELQNYKDNNNIEKYFSVSVISNGEHEEGLLNDSNGEHERLLNDKKSTKTRELKNKVSFDDDYINQQIDKLQNQLKLSSSVPSNSNQIESNSLEILSINGQLPKENFVEVHEDLLQVDLNESSPEPPNTAPRKSSPDPVDRLKEILLSQDSTPNSLDLPNLNLQQSTTQSIALEEESNSSKSLNKLEQINEIDEEPSLEPSTTRLDVSFPTDTNTDIPFPKVIFEEPVSPSNAEENQDDAFAIPELINELSSIQNSMDGLSITDKSPDELLSESKSIDQKSLDNTSLTDSVNSSKQNLDELSSLNVNSKSSSVDAESIKNRKIPVAFDMSDIKNMKSRKQRINSYVQKTLSLNQEETGLAVWLCLNIKKEPSTLYNSLKSCRDKSSNSLSRASSKSTASTTPSSTITAKVYSNPMTSSKSLSQITTNSVSLDNTVYSPSITPTSSFTVSSSKSSKSSKSSRTSPDISIQTSSLRLNSPPSSPRVKTSPFLSLSGINRRGSFSKVTRPTTFMPPIANEPLFNSSSTSLHSISKSPQTTTSSTPPKRQRRFSFQSVSSFSSRFNFSALNSTTSSFVTTIEEANDAKADLAVEVDDNALDKLCDVLPDADRDVLHKYLQKAGGKDDLMAVGLYMKDYKNGEVGKN
ncbi:2831_t:CDS:2 [Ambispora gerdemannii]|uniref:2831_t:CDS:1 n=1 Tax=Ambispora gerdemannii TaxID=144530 RepID=A0A9N9AH44_9GLOM|nr:2831_t:CDS:2 [Ambispora gerdemannii]